MVLEILAMTMAVGMLGVAAFFGVGAVQRSTAAEKVAARPRPGPAAAPPLQPPFAVPVRAAPPGYPYRPAPSPPSGLPPPVAPRAFGPPHGPGIRSVPYGPPPVPRSPRNLWAGAATTGTFGFVLLVVAVGSLLLSMSGGDRMLVTPAKAGGLERTDDPALRGSLERQKEYLREAGVPHPTVAFYREPGASTSNVAFAGGWGRIPNPGGNLRGVLRSIGRSFGAGSQPQAFPPGSLEGEVLCLRGGSMDGEPLAICGWADRSTIGVVMVREKTISECADMLLRMRPDMEKKRE